MGYLCWAGFAKHDGNDIETRGSILYIVCRKEVTGGLGHSGSFGLCNGGFGGLKILIGTGFYFYKH